MNQRWATAAVVVETGADGWRERRIREWLLLLLRFAVTRQPSDRNAVFAMADELDALGAHWRPSPFRFFLKTSRNICDAIVAAGDGPDNTNAVLRTHASRIKNPR